MIPKHFQQNQSKKQLQKQEKYKYDRYLIQKQSMKTNIYNVNQLSSNQNEILQSQNKKFELQLNKKCQLEVYEWKGILKKTRHLTQVINIQGINYENLEKNYVQPYTLTYLNSEIKEGQVEIKFSYFLAQIVIYDKNEKCIWRNKQDIDALKFQIINDYGLVYLNNVECYYNSQIYYSNIFGFTQSQNILFTEKQQQISSDGRVLFRINDQKGCLEIIQARKEWGQKRHFKSYDFKLQTSLQEYLNHIKDLDKLINNFKIPDIEALNQIIDNFDEQKEILKSQNSQEIKKTVNEKDIQEPENNKIIEKPDNETHKVNNVKEIQEPKQNINDIQQQQKTFSKQNQIYLKFQQFIKEQLNRQQNLLKDQKDLVFDYINGIQIVQQDNQEELLDQLESNDIGNQIPDSEDYFRTSKNKILPQNDISKNKENIYQIQNIENDDYNQQDDEKALLISDQKSVKRMICEEDAQKYLINYEYLDQDLSIQIMQNILNIQILSEEELSSKEEKKLQHRYERDSKILERSLTKIQPKFKNYNFRLNCQNEFIFVEDRYGNIVWKQKLSKLYSDDMIEIQNSGNLAVKNKDFEDRWQTFTGGIQRKILYYLEIFFEQIVDPALFIADTYSDIILLFTFYSTGHYNYFAILLGCMVLDRIIQFFYLLFLLLVSMNRDNRLIFGLKPKKHLYCGLCYAFTVFLYLDPLLDQQFKQYKWKKNKILVRKCSECIIEALPSLYVNIHSIFYSLEYGDNIHFTQYIALIFSLISISKSLFEVKVWMKHGGSWQKLLGPNNYLQGSGSIKASFKAIIMIFIFLSTYSYSLGVFTDIQRDYGFLYLFTLTFGFNYICLLILILIAILQEKKSLCDIICTLIAFLILYIPFFTLFLVLTVVLGVYLDWILDFKNDPFDPIFYILQWLISISRTAVSVLFAIIYYMEDNYDQATFGFIIYILLFIIQYTNSYLFIKFKVNQDFANYLNLYETKNNDQKKKKK